MVKLGPNFIDSESISLLSNAKIFSVNEFLSTDVEKLVMFSKLTYEKVIELKSHFLQQFTTFSSGGLDLFNNKISPMFVKTHIKGLDKLLGGGIMRGSILELCGPSGCGKTQLCHFIAVKCAIDSISVVIIDTKGDFSASRCNIMLPNDIKDEEMDNVLERISVYYSKNIYELISILTKIKFNLEQITGSVGGMVLIIDSLTAPYLPFVGMPSNKGFSIINFIASALKELAAEYSVTIILSNLGVIFNEIEDKASKTDQEVKPLMGKYWQHIPNTRIIITRDSESNLGRRLIINKSDYLEINAVETVYIKENGIL